MTMFPPSRRAALDRLAAYVPSAGRQYTNGRNTDAGPGGQSAVSRLSPYLRYRLLTEQEIVAHVLAHHRFVDAEKFVQEVLWRTYWKGWLEMRPSVWTRFIEERDRQRQSFQGQRTLVEAENGTTGIDGFDDWARALAQTGYLHNHARMWFASIWIFTLRLPWTLGADFFLRHLIDADAASNTLSWRWVAGLQTVGKTYLATADNIERHTEGRFRPADLATEALALTEAPIDGALALPALGNVDRAKPSLLLVTHDDMHPETVVPGGLPIAGALTATGDATLWGNGARAFVTSAMADTRACVAKHFACSAEIVETLDAAKLITSAQSAGVQQVVTAYAPVGPVASALAALGPVLARENIALVQIQRHWDSQFWPHARKGFFPFKEQIPRLLREEGLA